jgi:adenylate kinase
MLERLEQPLEQVIHLEVEDEEIVQRLLSRGRDDDSEEVIRNRLQVFSNQTQPLINYYEDQGKLVSVDGTGDMQAIYDRIVKALDR